MGRRLLAGAVLLGAVAVARPADAEDLRAGALVDRVIAAAGGMSAWRELRDVTFRLTSLRLADGDVGDARVSLLRLKRPDKIRVETLTGGGLLVQGFDGERPWVTLDGKADDSREALQRARFQSVNWWYWTGIPFKLRDPGVLLRHAGTVELRGRPLEALEVTFEPGVGATRDRYTYYVDPATDRIVFVALQLQPGVWPGVGGATPSWSGWLDYQRVGPFTVHTRRIFYGDGTLADRRGVARFDDIRVNTGLADALFRSP